MAFGIVELNSAMTGVHDYNAMKNNEAAKATLDQGNFQNQIDREVDVKLNNVHESEDANNRQKKFDARDKGSNEYSGNGGDGRKRKPEQKSDGKVTPKYSGFDIKI